MGIISEGDKLPFEVKYCNRLKSSAGICRFHVNGKEVEYISINPNILSYTDIILTLAHELAHGICILTHGDATHSEKWKSTEEELKSFFRLGYISTTTTHQIKELLVP